MVHDATQAGVHINAPKLGPFPSHPAWLHLRKDIMLIDCTTIYTIEFDMTLLFLRWDIPRCGKLHSCPSGKWASLGPQAASCGLHEKLNISGVPETCVNPRPAQVTLQQVPCTLNTAAA